MGRSVTPGKLKEPYLQQHLAINRHADVLDGICTARQPHHDDYRHIHRVVYRDIINRDIHCVLQDSVHWLRFTHYLRKHGHMDTLIQALEEVGRHDDATALQDALAQAS